MGFGPAIPGKGLSMAGLAGDRHIANDAAAEPATLGEAAYQRLRADIVVGTFRAGEPLRLEALKQRYGLSFSPLREALMRLQSERLVASTALRGFSVAPLSREEIEDATETRILIESEALRRSMRNGDDDWEARIVAAFHALSLQVERQSRNSGPVETADLFAMEERHHHFHRALIAELFWRDVGEATARRRGRAPGDHGRHAAPKRRGRASSGRALSKDSRDHRGFNRVAGAIRQNGQIDQTRYSAPSTT
jgi:hypothetical protein